MLRKAAEFASRRVETIVVMAMLAASSAYWIVIAFTMHVGTYGRLMAVQAVILLIAAILTLRTHDLTYFLINRQGLSPARAWTAASRLEMAAAAIVTAITTGWVWWSYRGEPLSAWLLTACAFLVGATVMQQASIALLRQQRRVDRIVSANLTGLAGWAASFIAVAALANRYDLALLAAGLVPQALVTVRLYFAARAVVRGMAGEDEPGHAPRLGLRTLLGYVAGGQTINLVKNGSTPVEILLLNAFATPEAVGLYRLGKSTLGLASAANNVAAQQVSASLTGDLDQARFARITWLTRIRTIRIALFAYAGSALFALAYAWFRPEVDMMRFQLIIALMAAAFAPSLFNTASFVLLSVHGQLRQLTMIFSGTFALMLVLALALFVWPSLWTMIGITAMAALVRLVWLQRAGRRFADTHLPPAKPASSQSEIVA